MSNQSGHKEKMTTISNQELMAYINQTMSAEDRAIIDQKILDGDDALLDALEGITALGRAATEASVQKVNNHFYQSIKSRRESKTKRLAQNKIGTYQLVALLVLLAIAIIMTLYFIK